MKINLFCIAYQQFPRPRRNCAKVDVLHPVLALELLDGIGGIIPENSVNRQLLPVLSFESLPLEQDLDCLNLLVLRALEECVECGRAVADEV